MDEEPWFERIGVGAVAAAAEALPPGAVAIVPRGGQGLGVVASRDLEEGEVATHYFGELRRIRGVGSPGRGSHAIQVVALLRGHAVSREDLDLDPLAIDGYGVCMGCRAEEKKRELARPLAGAFVNSCRRSTGSGGHPEAEANVDFARHELRYLAGGYAAIEVRTTRAIPEGGELLAA